ncbi:hypothetical protein HXW73_05205 [Halomonas sp. SH5A2]|uniref:hypothetical protein n=1 Tax=Halomonas sp. SH5A2 TaxID=2749040 RepID=UPI00163E725F|nr:hypothetical protein [Halomonas sp. SH5A2]QNI02376.1 hypothetical protein HXW73_05205 [Halomonas sp. SH5A2]
MKKIIYIAGYGRSGSTVLDIKIGEMVNGLSTGELGFFFRDVSKYSSSRCSCGESYYACEVWGRVFEKESFNSKVEEINRRCFMSPAFVAPYYWLKILLNGAVPSKKRLNNGTIKILDEAFLASPSGVVIDSSKTAWFCYKRPLYLKKLGYEVIVVHITRPLDDVLSSVSKGDNKVLMGDRKKEKFFKILRAKVSYFFSNKKAEKLSEEVPYLKVSQIDLKNDETATLEKINEFLKGAGLGACDHERGGAAHLVGGNRLKYKQVK